jgi:radical SAM superfamily enzyme with C-terminal helix-hairpin-helix motif
MPKIAIIDFYVDEPACLGVPPYLSPYIRYLAGALIQKGYLEKNIAYYTVDQLRESDYTVSDDYGNLFVIAGSTVPGKYLGGKIGTFANLITFLQNNNKRKSIKPKIFIGGPISNCPDSFKKKLVRAKGLLLESNPAGFVLNTDFFLTSEYPDQNILNKNYQLRQDQLRLISLAGAFITQKHPNFPFLVNEIETYSGCTRKIHCSFCTEALYGPPNFQKGNFYFRLGRQADLFSYGADMSYYRESFARPVPQKIEKLYNGIRNRVSEIKLLHMDNVNPGVLVHFPDESSKIASIISSLNTTGDTAAMGLESVDDSVIKKNSLKVNFNDGIKAVKLINKYGAFREHGIPKLLPGINFIGGLPGESEKTFEINFNFLQRILDEDLLIRRINIRQVMRFPHTRVYHYQRGKGSAKLKKKFDYYKKLIRKKIDVPMLRRVFPEGTLISEIIIENNSRTYSMGRPLGSYPITVKIPFKVEKRTILEKVIILGYSERTLNALPWPVDLENIGVKELSLMPGISAKMASSIILNKKKISVREQVEKIPELNKIFPATGRAGMSPPNLQ